MSHRINRKKKIIIGAALACALVATGASIIGYQDWQLRGSAPGNPASGYFRIWADNTAQIFKCLTSAGAACHFEANASSSQIGIVKTDGSTISASAGTISCTTATSSQLGCVKNDASTISNSAGTLSCTTATTSQLGCVKPDGTTVTISGGVISASGGSATGSTWLNTLTASNSASLSDTTSLTSSYDEYDLHFLGILPATNGAHLLMRFSTNGGSSYDSGSNYSHSALGFTVAGSGLFGSQNDTAIDVFDTGLYNVSPRSSSGLRHLYIGSGLYPTMHGESQHVTATDQTANTAEGDIHNAVYRVSSPAPNAMQFLMSSGNIASGVIRIYGLHK